MAEAVGSDTMIHPEDSALNESGLADLGPGTSVGTPSGRMTIAMFQWNRKMGTKKRAITVLINVIERNLMSLTRVSRTRIRLDLAALEKVLAELQIIVQECLSTDLVEAEQERIELYLLEQEQRVRNVTADVHDHLEGRKDEVSTIFGSKEEELREMQRQAAQTTNPTAPSNYMEVPQDVHHGEEQQFGRTQDVVTGRVQALTLDGRFRDIGGEFVDSRPNLPLPIDAPTTSNWMANPERVNRYGTTRSARTTLDIKMSKFNGKLLEFSEWANMFQALVHNSDKSTPEKMGMLKASLGDDCRRLICGYGNSEEHYHAALRIFAPCLW